MSDLLEVIAAAIAEGVDGVDNLDEMPAEYQTEIRDGAVAVRDALNEYKYIPRLLQKSREAAYWRGKYETVTNRISYALQDSSLGRTFTASDGGVFVETLEPYEPGGVFASGFRRYRVLYSVDKGTTYMHELEPLEPSPHEPVWRETVSGNVCDVCSFEEREHP